MILRNTLFGLALLLSANYILPAAAGVRGMVESKEAVEHVFSDAELQDGDLLMRHLSYNWIATDAEIAETVQALLASLRVRQEIAVRANNGKGIEKIDKVRNAIRRAYRAYQAHEIARPAVVPAMANENTFSYLNPFSWFSWS